MGKSYCFSYFALGSADLKIILRLIFSLKSYIDFRQYIEFCLPFSFLIRQLPSNKGGFKWVSRVIRVCFGSALCDWLTHFTPFSQPIRGKTKTNRDLRSKGALRRQKKMSRPVLSDICPLLYKTVENPATSGGSFEFCSNHFGPWLFYNFGDIFFLFQVMKLNSRL